MVERFDGPDGTELSFAIEKALRSAKIDGRPYFQMTADSSRSEAVISGTARVSVDEFDQYQARTKCVELDANDQCIKNKEIKKGKKKPHTMELNNQKNKAQEY